MHGTVKNLPRRMDSLQKYTRYGRFSKKPHHNPTTTAMQLIDFIYRTQHVTISKSTMYSNLHFFRFSLKLVYRIPVEEQ
jgi:hypothetical protein